MRVLLLTSVVLLLTGCPTKIVYVPVETCPEPKELIVVPQLQKDLLPANATTGQKLEAIRFDYKNILTELERCIVVLDGYRGKAK